MTVFLSLLLPCLGKQQCEVQGQGRPFTDMISCRSPGAQQRNLSFRALSNWLLEFLLSPWVWLPHFLSLFSPDLTRIILPSKGNAKFW